jgi:elongation factor 1-beta
MGDVAAKLKVMPESPEVDLEGLREHLEAAVPEGAEVRAFEEESVAFGLVALYASVVVPDDAGGTGAVEDAFADTEGVESVEVEETGRL